MRLLRLTSLLAAALTVCATLAPTTVSAQTITACSADRSGTLYRVGIPGAPADCTKSSHTKATWSTNGSAPDIVVDSTSVSAPAGTQFSGSVTCPTGYTVIGGGFESSGVPTTVGVWTSRPHYYTTYSFWQVRGYNSGANGYSMKIQAICMKRP
ncbi:hypothetical protein [Gemmatimonas phototrophica]|uniref:Ig-like domain-containing protein n=1 Tax=Gemmatimonas phototrophica TaxID=1379270 RepID=A0A143BFR2_9BACT|nr:hypothetical protein [Gemmatimonas phototrophica]AMW03848.1 hypothetical protein GEMMAAP_01300 [Gemmatimonas phototrophica]